MLIVYFFKEILASVWIFPFVWGRRSRGPALVGVGRSGQPATDVVTMKAEEGGQWPDRVVVVSVFWFGLVCRRWRLRCRGRREA
ncbi:hypothetical protein EUGRSUZ_H04552 [Eucalyptus grandis]|uniref:Uncharacterized protein n=2 Tax=Eucalyptus grandis TaxID=71139 RepID=A0ACC3JXE7_EUCGR|nr:hypothetical protein EUGRSUZ_H04552 [Eucalyptus grandis]